jgi:hypothetical protein
MIFEQTFLKPGRYHVGGNRYRDISPDFISAHVSNTKQLLEDGNNVPILLEHAEPGSEQGSPRDKKAGRIKHGVGWLSDIRVGEDGAAVHVLDIRSKEAAEKMRDGSIKFTSPEFRHLPWIDGKGREYKDYISHVALTHHPRNVEQSKLEPVEPAAMSAVQFSLADEIQMADENDIPDDDDTEKEETPNETPANPDLETTTSGDQELEAVLALLEEVAGIALPAATTLDTIVHDLLTALKTKKASEEKPEPEEGKEDDEPINEEQQPMPVQFSLADVEAGKVENKLLAKVIKHNHDSTLAKLDSLVNCGKITPDAKAKLVTGKAVQFSADGDELPAYTLGDFATILDRTLLHGMALSAEQLSADATEHKHPEGFFDGSNETEEDAEAAADEVFGVKKDK